MWESGRGNNVGKVGYFDTCLPFFDLLNVSEAVFCVLPIVKHAKTTKTAVFKYSVSTKLGRRTNASDNRCYKYFGVELRHLLGTLILGITGRW